MPSDFSLDSGDISSDTKTICEDAFAYQSNLVSVVIPASVTYIGVSAFRSCFNLSSIIFEDSSDLATIDSSAFNGCTSLNGIVLPTSLTKVFSHSLLQSK
ncbi:MAG: leucine-rich repeat domain-containing protein [Clostridia bacterium]|nr:leucine-rich repeat domain-containing protein [Clostridia bacterium]